MTATRAFLIACGEPAVSAALAAFEAARFSGLPVERVLLPGGCWWLAEAASAGRLKRIIASRSAALDGVSAMISGDSVSEVALLGHQDCHWYHDRAPAAGPGELVRRIGQDLYIARDEILRVAGRALTVTGHVLIRRAGAEFTPRQLFPE